MFSHISTVDLMLIASETIELSGIDTVAYSDNACTLCETAMLVCWQSFVCYNEKGSGFVFFVLKNQGNSVSSQHLLERLV